MSLGYIPISKRFNHMSVLQMRSERRVAVQIIDGETTTLTQEDTGNIIIIPKITLPTDITLPDAVDAKIGAEYEFITSNPDQNTASCVINCPGRCFGCIHDVSGDGEYGSDRNGITLGSCLYGTILFCTSDGTQWTLKGYVEDKAHMFFN